MLSPLPDYLGANEEATSSAMAEGTCMSNEGTHFPTIRDLPGALAAQNQGGATNLEWGFCTTISVI